MTGHDHKICYNMHIMVTKRKTVHYRHRKKRQKGSFRKALKRNIRKLGSRLGRKIRANKLRSLIIFLGIFIVAVLMISHHLSSAERISSNGYVHASRFSNSVVVDGIDVSYAQGDNIDWDSIKKAGVDFVFIRAGYRATSSGTLHKDDNFEENIKGAEKAGLMVGAYFYSQATTSKEARDEAAYLVRLVSPYDIDLPLVMDYETYGSGRLATVLSKGNLTQNMVTQISLAFCHTVEQKGYESMVYGNYDFLMHRQNPKTLGENTSVWLAHYTYSTPYYYNYTFWQCSASAKVSGISGSVDKDFWYFYPEKVYRTSAANASERTSLQDCTVNLKDHSSRYIGFSVEPGVTVYDGKAKLTEGVDYRVSYIRNTSPGTGYAIVTGIGDYKDSLSMSFKIKKFL